MRKNIIISEESNQYLEKVGKEKNISQSKVIEFALVALKLALESGQEISITKISKETL